MNISSQVALRSLDPMHLASCAQMMADSDPWKRLAFSVEECRHRLSDDSIDVIGAYTPDTDGPLGFLASMAKGFGGEPLLDYLCVHETVRSQGIGTQLVHHFETAMFDEADNLYLFVSDINPQAMRLYDRLGYRQIGCIPNYNHIGQSEFLMRKSRRPRCDSFSSE